jgi:hypothetical protein
MFRLSALICVAALLGAGCDAGDDDRLSREEYEQRVEQALDDVQSSLEDVRGSRSRDDVVDGLSESAEAARGAADDLEDVNPPEVAEDANERLVEALRRLADELDRGAEAAEEGSPTEFLEAARSAGEERREQVEDALRDLERQGIEVPELRFP